MKRTRQRQTATRARGAAAAAAVYADAADGAPDAPLSSSLFVPIRFPGGGVVRVYGVGGCARSYISMVGEKLHDNFSSIDPKSLALAALPRSVRSLLVHSRGSC